jgi:NADH dehydrogenase
MHFGGFIGWVVWLFIHIGFLTGWRNRIGALFSWWFAFARDLRRERTFTIDDMPVRAFSEQAEAAASGRHAARPDNTMSTRNQHERP